MRVVFADISKRFIAVAVILAVFAGLYNASVSMALNRWKRQMFSPGLTNKTVIIDPGHGGADPGAISGKLREADLNMKLALVLKKQLESKHVRVKLTRDGQDGLVPDQAMSYLERWLILEKRKRFALDQRGHMLISIHVNSNPDKKTSGGIVFYSDGISRGLAVSVQNQLNSIGIRHRQIEQGNFTIIKGNVMPSVLVEAGFITNKHDTDLLTSKPELVATAICNGLEDYARNLKSKTTGNGGL